MVMIISNLFSFCQRWHATVFFFVTLSLWKLNLLSTPILLLRRHTTNIESHGDGLHTTLGMGIELAGPGSSELPIRTTVVLVAIRLILVPLIGIAVVTTADKLGFLPPQDPLFRFVLFMQHAMPSSIQIGEIEYDT